MTLLSVRKAFPYRNFWALVHFTSIFIFSDYSWDWYRTQVWLPVVWKPILKRQGLVEGKIGLFKSWQPDTIEDSHYKDHLNIWERQGFFEWGREKKNKGYWKGLWTLMEGAMSKSAPITILKLVKWWSFFVHGRWTNLLEPKWLKAGVCFHWG